MGDPLQNTGLTRNSPGIGAMSVTVSDTAVLLGYDGKPQAARELFVGGGGNIQMTLAGMAAGTSVVFSGVVAGSRLSYAATQVWAAGTTATGIVSVW